MAEPSVLLVLATSTGGVGQHVRSLVREFVAAGVTVHVAGSAATDELFGFSRLGAAFTAVEVSTLPRPAADTRAVRALRRLLGRADVVHAHGLRAGFVAAAAVRTSRPRRPLVVTWHNAMLGGGLKARALAGLERVVARSAQVTFGASSDLVDRARSLGARDARLGPVAAPPLRPPQRSREQVRADLDTGERPVLLAIGRLAPQKGYPMLLDAAAAWAERTPPPLVVIAGDGPLHGQFQQRIDAERLPVRLLGHRTDVRDLLSAADVVVLPSAWEARALVAQEALRAGVPLVASAVGGVPDLVGDAALLVPYGDPQALADAVAHVLDDPGTAARLASAGPRRAASWPDEAAAAAQVLGVYRELVGRAAR